MSPLQVTNSNRKNKKFVAPLLQMPMMAKTFPWVVIYMFCKFIFFHPELFLFQSASYMEEQAIFFH